MNRKQIKTEAFNKGRKSGIWMAYNYIFPVPLEGMDQRLLNAVAMSSRIPGYSKMSQVQLLHALRDRGISKATFKNNNGRAELITK